MHKKFWENISDNYQEAIFDVFKNDKNKTVQNSILKFASPQKSVVDIGCAIGKWLPLLSSEFKKVYAIDFADKYISHAKAKYGRRKNISFITTDITKQTKEIPPCDVALCVNAILVDSDKKRAAFFKGIAKCLHTQGHLILVVPSLESALYSEFMYNQWNLREGIHSNTQATTGILKKYKDLKKGIIELDNTPTKHFLKEELIVCLKNEGFQVLATEKVEYLWKTEFVNPPQWMQSPFPWDWLVIAQKVK